MTSARLLMSTPLTYLLYSCLFSLLLLQKGCGHHEFKIEVIQEGEVVSVEGKTVTLEREPFKLRFTLVNQEGVFMSSSFEKMYYGLEKDEPIPDYKYLPSKTRATKKYNKDRELVLHPELVSYPNYSKDSEWHRFDKGSVEADWPKVVGVKTIEQFWVKEKDKTIPVEEMDRTVYMFFLAAPHEWDNEDPPEERGRYKFQIEWVTEEERGKMKDD